MSKKPLSNERYRQLVRDWGGEWATILKARYIDSCIRYREAMRTQSVQIRAITDYLELLETLMLVDGIEKPTDEGVT